jgi:hypothetical protein
MPAARSQAGDHRLTSTNRGTTSPTSPSPTSAIFPGTSRSVERCSERAKERLKESLEESVLDDAWPIVAASLDSAVDKFCDVGEFPARSRTPSSEPSRDSVPDVYEGSQGGVCSLEPWTVRETWRGSSVLGSFRVAAPFATRCLV